MKTIVTYLRRYWPFAFAAPFLMMLEVFMDLTLPAIMAKIVDDGIAAQNMSIVLKLGSQMLLVTVIAFIGGGGCSVMSTFASTGLGADLRKDLFQKVLSLSYKNLDALETGNLITRLTNDVTQLEDVSRMMLRIMIRAPLQIIGSLVMAIIISPSLSFSFLVFIPVLLVSLGIVFSKAYPLFYIVQSKLDALNNRIRENLAGKRLVKAFVREEFEEKKFGNANSELTDTMVKASRTIAFMHPIMQFILNAGIITILWFGAKLIDSNALKVGGLIAFLSYLRQLLFSLMMFSHLLLRFSRAQASSVRIQEVFASTPDIAENINELLDIDMKCIDGSIEVKNVSFFYNEQSDSVLDDISFSLKPGQTLAIIGATGSGKSSLANLIPRFYDVQNGSIIVNGIDIKEYPVKALRSIIAVAPQQTTLFSGTIRKNILFHYPDNDIHSEELDNLMKQSAFAADVSSFIESLPEAYETDINQRGVNLSGGQKQRIAIARALAKKPGILILDDATSSVDLATERRIQKAMSELPKQSTFAQAPTKIIIAQRVSSIMSADLILVLDDGNISGIGTHDDLLKDNAIYKDIYKSQIDTEYEFSKGAGA